MDIIQFLGSKGREIVIFFTFLFSLCFHEFAHGWMARRKGDRTAEMMGRLTLNPMVHIDWIGTVVLPLFALFGGFPFFGWAKPVPVNSRNLSHPRQDMFWIAFAGPLSNMLLAICGTIFIFLIVALGSGWSEAPSLIEIAKYFILINMFLAAFNLLPLHPLDGGKVLARFLPVRWNQALEDFQQYAMIVLVLIFVAGAFKYLAAPVFWISQKLVSIAFGLGLLLNS
ncbi:MAG: site-2 protease family protein [Bdellovibrionales bacterium]|nr:site-2 protease family protein [Bdellovibrionales bacterium]